MIPKWIVFGLVQVVANLVTFLLYKYWAFDAAKVGRVGPQYARQLVVFGVSWLLNIGIPSVLTYRVGLGPTLSFAISNVFVYACWNYPMNRIWVFADASKEA